MSTGPDDQIKHPDSLTGTSEADAPAAPVVPGDSDVKDEPGPEPEDA
jgi:hypothetical protein